MKKKLTSIVLTAALGLFAGFAANAAGDILDIRPCDANGQNLDGAVASLTNPLKSGEDLYFKIRLIAPQANGSRWYIKYTGIGSPEIAEFLQPMQIGIYVSGRLDYATLVSYAASGNFSTELVFKYTTKPGDFALPIVLAAKESEYAVDTYPSTSDNGGVYALNPLRSFWNFAFDQTSDPDPGTGAVTTNTVLCSWRVRNPVQPPLTEADYLAKWHNNTTLADCGFFVKTIDFSSDDEDSAYWRSVHENSTITGGGIAPRLVIDAPSTNAVTLYVWSENESAFYVDTDNIVNMRVDSAGTIEPRHVGTVTFAGGQATPADFAIRGATGGEGKTANVVLSAYPYYNFSSQSQRLDDFLTKPVKCIQPMPPSIVVESDRAEIVANSAYTQYAAILQVYLSQAYSNDLYVTITPQFTDVQGEDWKDYFRFSTTSDTIDEPMADNSDAQLPVVRIPADSTDRQTIYVFALRSDTHTIGSNKVKFQSSIDDPEAQSIIAEANRGSKSLNVRAEITSIIAPEEGSKAVSTTCNDEFPFTIAVSDTYADTHDTETGYQIYIKYRSSDTFVQLDGSYYVGDGGALYKLDTSTDPATKTAYQPVLKYTVSGLDLVSEVYVVPPVNQSKNVGRRESEHRKFLADVKEARTASLSYWDETYTEEKRSFNEGESMGIKIKLSEKYEDADRAMYAYLKPSSGATADMFAAAPYNFILGMDNPEGIPVENTDEIEGMVMFLDGLATPGLTISFEVVLSYDQFWDGTDETNKRIKGYASTKPNVKVYNVEPTILDMEMNNLSAEENAGGNNGKFANKLPMGQTQKFKAIVDDPGTYDLENTVKPFKVMWTAMLSDGTTYDDPVEKLGNPEDNLFEYAFPAAGEWKVSAKVMDKDMKRWSAVTYTVYVTVLDQPAVEQTPGEEMTLVERLNYNDSDNRKFTVGVGYWDPKYNGELTVMVQVTSMTPAGKDPGLLEFDAGFRLSAADAEARLNALADPEHPYDANSDYYLVTLNRTTLAQALAITAMDGTDYSSIYGFRIQSFVVNDDMLPTSHAAANAYYLTSQPTTIFINNLEPEIGANTTLENTNSWKVSGGAATQYPIRWQVKYDVDRDWTETWADGSGPGIKITFSGCQNAEAESKFITEAQSGTFVPNFGSAQGDQIVTMTIEDKDGGTVTFTYLYTVEPSKFLKTLSTGPSGGTTTSTLSQKYYRMNARGGLGQGHTFVADATFSTAENFELAWNCGKQTYMSAYAFGYRFTDAPTMDNNTLNGGMDIGIDINGNQNGDRTLTDWYVYNPTDGKDSYFYLWILTTLDENGAASDIVLGNAISPEVAGPPGKARIPLPTAQTEDGAYLDTIAEAVFSKEWKVEDNLGDINQDGIPDTFAVTPWGSGESLIRATTGLENVDGDLVDIAAGNPDEDYLPGVYAQDSTSLLQGNYQVTIGGITYQAGAKNSYAPVGIAFNNRMEIRGLHEGLNETVLTRSEPSFSKDEQKAWEVYAAANGLDPVADLSFENWTPEPRGTGEQYRMDPTMDDTDSDGFPDGWEYFFWYQAKVWAPAGADLGKPKAGQHFVFERFNPLNIIIGNEIPAEEVMERFNPCVPYEREEYDGPKWLKNDFDHDGLTDLEELVIGTNPCHWDTDGDRLSDAWEVMTCLDPLNGSKNGNPDGDFMAFHSVRLDMCWIDPADAANYAMEIAMAGEGLPEDVRIYGLPGLRMGIDYDIDATGRFVMLQTMDVVSYSFNPKWLGGEQLTYGIRPDDIPMIIPPDWVWGWFMVDNVVCETIHLNAGDEIFPNLEFVLIHDQVRDGFGFDPRTGWHVNGNGYVVDRWDPGVNENILITDVTGLAVNTRAYANYDEYLVMKYRVDYGLDYSPMTTADGAVDPNDENVWNILRTKTTNPNVVRTGEAETDAEGETAAEGEGEEGEGGAEGTETAANETQPNAAGNISSNLAAAFNSVGSDKSPITSHGADTDGDGVPDGWELYMYRNPNGAADPDDEDGLGLPMQLDFDGDELSFVLEYAGTDSCEAYKDCASIYANHPGNKSKWFNKFFPTNPGTMKLNDATGTTIFAGFGNADGADTDLDGITDAMEGGAWISVFANGGNQVVAQLGFVYGNPTDDGLTVCFRGGGMNPCTIDTDLDGIPDGWEMQHAGVPVQLPGKTVVDPEGGDVGGIELDATTFIADGINGDGNLPEVVYIAGGMDATWKGDAVFSDINDPDLCLSWDDLLNTRRDVDFDHDGLQNYQEYLTQSIRHFRYDDITTPLMGRQLEEGTYDPFTSRIVDPHTQSFGDSAGGHDGTGVGYPVFDPADPATFAANAAEAWNGRSFIYYQTVTTGVREVIKVVDPYTGATSTNRIYYTAQKKMARPGATLAAKHVASGGTALQYAWTADGWRDAGYFAPPRRDWDRAVASTELAAPLYMWPITGSMVGYTSSIAGYATTDPRISDTDGDGMDDFYEMYHGLNPLLGTTPATADQTDWGLEILEGKVKFGDIVSAQFWVAGYPLADSRPTFNAWYNEWMYPRYSGLLGRAGGNPGDEVGGPIQAPQAYDPVLYPWGMGTAMVDADGDGVRNDEERILANVADPVGRHTDPSPLWFTERTTPASYVAQYYVQSPMLAYMPWTPSPLDSYEEAAQRVMTDATADIYFGGGVSYQYSFEENEGYDTDGDMTPDEIEFVSTVRKSSDPLRFDDPARSQAFYLPGENSYAVSRDLHIRPIDSVDFLKQFTVECWVLPEKQGVAQTIIDRAVAYEGNSINTDKLAIRSNFRIGLDAQGKVYGMFDNNDSIESGLDAPKSCQFVDGGPLPLNEWSHIALTFDGSTLMIYVNGVIQDSAPTQLIPANGVTLINQDTAATNGFMRAEYRCDPSALLIGARPKKQNLYALYPYYIEGGLHMESFDNLQEYFQGYVDEVRVWDGARTGAQISENFRKMIGFTQASENRDEVFESWYYNNGSRNNNDGNPTLPPELVLNYDFSTLPGAVNEPDVAKTPAGFTKNVLYAAMSDYSSNGDIDTTGLYPNLLDLKGVADGGVEGDLLVGWWNETLVHSTVYDDYHVVPWIKNTVSHLPLIDGGAVDSFMYGDQFGSVYMSASDLGVAKLVFPNTAMPYPSTVFNNDKYYRLAHAMILTERRGESFNVALGKSRFQVRNNFIGTADLVPMGGAFAKTCKKMWNNGASDPWEQTRDDSNGDGIPDWWEEYARHNYAADLDPALAIGWDTMIDYHGARIPAGKAYVIDIYRGMQPDGTIDPEYAVNTDEDGDNLPDWWENLFGVAKYGADDDPDNDGLSNYDEYLFSFGATPYGMENGFPFLDPARQRSGSGQKVTDYFLAGLPDVVVSADGSVTNIFANQYLGEIATDHDFMEGWWEKTFSNSYANQYVYDPDKDTDGDGWDNFSENRAATWYGTLLSDSITRYLSDQVVLNNYPQPAIGLRFTYNGGIQDVSGKSVVVRTMTKANGRTDATFTVVAPEASNVGVVAYTPGAFIDAKTPIHGFLQPGSILPQSCYIYGVHLSKEGVYFWGIPTTIYRPTAAGNTYPASSGTYISNMTLTTGNGAAVECWYFTGSFTDYIADVRAYGRDNVMLDNPALDFELIGKAVSRDDGRRGDAVIMSAQTAVQTTFGSFNFLTGEFSLDPAALEFAGLQPDGMLVKLEYEYAISAEWPQTLWLNQPTIGRVKQGLNTIEAWMDLNGDGAYTAGEPYGVIRNVNIGWHKTAEMVLELKDTSTIIPHYLLSDGSSDRAVIEGVAGGVAAVAAGGEGGGEGNGLTAKVAVRRVSINGQRMYGLKTVPSRTLVSKSYILDDRAYLTEADVLSDDKFDLDWKWLVSDAAKLGLAVSDINTVEYEIDRVNTLGDGSVTNIAIATFVNSFGRQRPVPVTRAPLAAAPVYSAAPTFSWTCSDNTMTAFRLQVSTSTNAADIVYDTGIKQLPGSDSLTVGTFGYSFTAPIYAGAPISTNGAPVFLDGSNYFWRVIEFNAKYNDVDPKFWSSWTQFQIDVVNANINPRLPTGYGKCGAIVRYYGANTNDLAGLVVVEAHQSADFAGQPLAQMRADVSQLADRDDLQTTNAEFAGIEPGTVYLMAYIDANNNGKRDVNESWGYANYVGTEALSLFTPQGVKVTDEILRSPSVVIYIEDTDFNRNEILDCIETTLAAAAGGTEVSAGDGDRDGLLDEEEDGFATDSSVWDTDGDGMPDGWEVKFADLDPTFFDAVEAVDSDVMAFVTNTCTIVTVQNTDGSESVNYILKDNGRVPIRGDSIEGYELYEIYDYPVATEDGLVNCYGRGALVTNLVAAAGTTNRVVAVSSGMVALVHAQVYEEFGFNPKTANPTAYEDETAVNTKQFTALDKYLLIRYFAALGICNEDDVNVNGKWAQYSLKPFDIDNDKDGAPDGWELYVMFGKNEMNLDNFTNGTAISCWNFDDRESDDDGDGLPLTREFEGAAPTDPWNAHTISSAFTDFDAWKYGLKTPEAQLSDGDNDGLSNIQEYRALAYGLDLNIGAMKTDGETIDYFRIVDVGGVQHYIGELVADHDFMEDYLEDEHGFDRGLYDATKDADKDGWSNWAELRSYVESGVEYVADIVSNRVIRTNISVEEYDTIRNNYEVIEDTINFNARYDDAGNLIGSSVTGSIIYFDTQAVMRAQSLYSGTPYPTVVLTVAYDGEKDIDAGGIVVEAYSSAKMQKKLCWWNLTAADFSSKFAHNGYITLELKTPDHGYLKEGTVHFAVFADMDSNGTYNGAEPFGIAKDVKVGYDRATDFTVELKDITPVVPRIDFVNFTCDRVTLMGTTTNTSNVVWGETVAPAEGEGEVADGGQQQGGFAIDGEEVRVRVIRTAINGDDTAKKRTLLNRVFTVANRSYLHEGDFMTSLKNDLDPYLAADAKAIGIAPANVYEATYEVVLGDAKYKAGSTNANEGVVATFVNSYPKSRATGTPLAPSANSRGVLTTAQATFDFAADTSAYTAYVLEVSDSDTFATILHSTTNLLTGAVKGAVSATPAWYFEDGKTYYWRVALMNGKYTTLDKLSDADVVWSDTAEFTVDLHGEATANVNYFGPAETDGKIVVEAYLSPDFVGDPIARVEGGSLVDGTNAILVAGLPSGKLYLLAFVDRNGDGVRQSYESWGYACKVGTLDTDLWTPVPVTVNAETLGDPVVADIYIEDTDINQNFSVDPLDDEEDLKAAEEVIASEGADEDSNDQSDRDGDGLKGYEEEEIGTDPDNVDSDGDGMWDGWEVWADTDPLSPEDATEAADGDVMAYAEVTTTIVRTRSTMTGLEALYMIPEDMAKPSVGDNMNGLWMNLAYEYGSPDIFGVGILSEVPTSAEYLLATVENTVDGTTADVLFDAGAAIDVGTNVTDFAAYEVAGIDGGLYLLGGVTNLVVDTTIVDPTPSNVVTAVSIVDVSLGENRVIEVNPAAKVALIHNQVYKKYGFSSKTAVSVDDAINTKPFTALDKYLLIRYFEAQGLCDERTVNATGDWASWTLKPGVIDGDWGDADGRYGDGVADGWELYVGYNPWDFDDRFDDSNDGDGLPLYLEFDAGNVPTDPWFDHSVTLEFDDYDAWRFGLKTPEMQLSDGDNDGLSNVQEYRAYRDYGLDLDIAKMRTDSWTIDYFRQVDVGGYTHYIGEVVADHDFMEDFVEDGLGFDRGLYDATKDADKNGWSNWSEARARYDEGTWIVTGEITNTYTRTFNSFTPEAKAQWQMWLDTYWTPRAGFTAWLVSDRYYDASGAEKEWGSLNASVQDDVSCEVIWYEIEETKGYGGNPLPKVRLTIAYNGEKDIDAGGIVVEAYSSAKMQKKLCWWTLTPEVIDSRLAHNGYVTLELTTPDHGYLKEGTTHFAVFADMDSSGTYNGAEPFGIAKNVEVGYNRATDFTVELKDITPVVPRIDFANLACDRVTLEGTTTNTSNVAWGDAFAIDGEEVRVRVIRTAINGNEDAKKRTLLNRVFTVANRSYLHEGDFMTSLKNDLDPYLAVDAKAIGIAPASISEATYEVVLGDAKYKAGSTNENEGVIATFVNSYPKTRATGTPIAPSANSRGTLTTAQATFDFKADTSAYTAYVLEVSDSDTFANILHSTTNLLTGAVKGTVSATPAWYFEDGKTYYWRVALMNGKYVTLDKLSAEDVVWSETAEFTADLRGEATAAVNYFGPAETDGKIVVEAYLSPDFVGDPIARVEGGSLVAGAESIPVVGLPSGEIYLLAFIDRNGDGVRQSYESWGYACKVGTLYTDLWTPISVTVRANALVDPAVAEIYIEDTDINQNFIVDPLDDEEDLEAAEETIENENSDDDSGNDQSDRDGDGLKGYEEEEIGTDPDNRDTDGDGMWDGWEVWAGTDPLSPEDATEAADGDVMAYAEVTRTIVKTRSTMTGLEAFYIMPEDAATPTVGDNMNGKILNLAYEYGRPDLFGIGMLSEVPTSVEYLLATVENEREGTTGSFLFEADALIDVGTNVTDFVAYEIAGMDDGLYLLGMATNLVVDTTLIDPTPSNIVTAVESVQVSLGENRVIEIVSPAKVALIHNQVYKKYGFSSKTAVPIDDAINTKPFTALDKYLLIRYFEAQGLCDEKSVNANCEWALWSLKPDVIDGDWGDDVGRYGDGIADGWELYVDKDPWDFDDREDDDDGDGLPLYREFDVGNVPTNPWYHDTDGDGVFDSYAYYYHLKGDQAGEDPDEDGLSNYAEYLISEVFQIIKLDPNNPMTHDSTLDYYQKFGELYLGEIFTDHDRIADDWEAEYEFGNTDGVDYAARGIYDPDADLDHDGWSNYAEFRAGTSPAKQMDAGIDNYTLIEHPVPVVEMEVVYNGSADIEGRTLTVSAWNEALDPNALAAPIAKWTVTTVNESDTAALQNATTGEELKEKYIGRMPKGKKTYYLGFGAVKEGSFKLCVKDKSYVEGDIVTMYGQNYFMPTELGDPDTALWFFDVIDDHGKLVTLGGIFAEAHQVGTIDYNSGRVTIDFDDEEFTRELYVGDPEKSADSATNTDNNNGNNNGNNGNGKYHGLNPPNSHVKFTWSPVFSVPVRGVHFLGDTAEGFLREGLTTFVVDAAATASSEENGGNNAGNNNAGTEGGQTSTTFNNAHIYGVVRHVDVGWAGAKFKVELTDFNPITSRIDLRSGTFDRAEPLVVTDPRINIVSNVLQTVTAQDSIARVRVVRYAINGYPIVETWGRGLADVVYDKTGEWNRLFCELDFLLGDKFDLDWTSSFTAKIANTSGVTRGADGTAGNISQVIGTGTSVTNMQYMVVIGDGDVAMERPDSTNTTINALGYLITRRFDYSRAKPVAVAVDGVQYSARPTFKWRMSGEEAVVKRFGSSYTAFRLRVNKGSNVVYDSGILRAPAIDADGNFTWTAPICAGSILENGQSFDTVASYSWQVSMYNAKFRSDSWSESSVFSTAANAQQEVNDHGYSSIAIAVKYAGPSVVLGKYADLTTAQGKVVVQAFTTPDFAGNPLAQTVVTNDVDALAIAEANGWLKGLPAIGTYFIRAFIDMDGDGKLSEWEPWGYVADEVALVNDGTIVKAPLVSVWIEDSDSDRDWVPDAYEYAAKGWTTSWETLKGNKKTQPGGVTTVLANGGIVLTLPVGDLTDAGISTGLPGASLTAMQSPNFVAAVMGITTGTYQTTLEAIAEATRGKLVPKSVRVVAFSLAQDGSTVNLTVGAEVASGIAGSIVEQYYQFAGSDTVKVNVKVLKKNALSDTEWTVVYTTAEPVSITADMHETIPVQIDDQDLKSGFFKLELEEVP